MLAWDDTRKPELVERRTRLKVYVSLVTKDGALRSGSSCGAGALIVAKSSSSARIHTKHNKNWRKLDTDTSSKDATRLPAHTLKRAINADKMQPACKCIVQCDCPRSHSQPHSHHHTRSRTNSWHSFFLPFFVCRRYTARTRRHTHPKHTT